MRPFTPPNADPITSRPVTTWNAAELANVGQFFSVDFKGDQAIDKFEMKSSKQQSEMQSNICIDTLGYSQKLTLRKHDKDNIRRKDSSSPAAATPMTQSTPQPL